MALPVGLYLLINPSGPDARGVMSTDTALALGLLSLVSRSVPKRVKGLLLTLFIVDDLASLVVIAAAHSHGIHLIPLLVGVAAFGVILVVQSQASLSRTPTFFINGQRHYGAYDIQTLHAAVLTAREEAARRLERSVPPTHHPALSTALQAPIDLTASHPRGVFREHYVT